jgi:xylulose-5-phosphate/fructose-6-phosphate phosphoketolase
MIVLRSPKGWTCPKEIDGKPRRGSWRSHQVPMGEMHEKARARPILEQWLKSYRPRSSSTKTAVSRPSSRSSHRRERGA